MQVVAVSNANEPENTDPDSVTTRDIARLERLDKGY